MISALRKVLIGLCLLILVVALVVIGGYGYLQTDAGRERVTEGILRALTDVEDVDLDIDGLAGVLPFAPAAERITVADAKGAWLELTDVRLSVEPWGLLFGRVVVENIESSRVRVLRKPEFAPDEKPLPRFPLVVIVEELRVGWLSVEPELATEIASDWRALSVYGQGRVDLLRHRLSTQWRLSSERLAFADSRVSIANADLDLEVNGAFTEPSFEVAASATDLAYDEFSSRSVNLEGSVASENASQGWTLTLSAGAQASGLGSPEAVSGLIGDTLAIKIGGSIVPETGVFDFDTVQADAADVHLDARLARESSGKLTVSDFAGEFNDLGKVVSRADALAGASALISGQAHLASDDSVAADLAIELNAGSVADPLLAAVLGDGATAEFGLTLDSSGAAHVVVQDLETAVVRATGAANLLSSGEDLEGSFEISLVGLERLSIEDVDLIGDVLARIDVEGSLDRFSIDARVRPRDLLIDGREITSGNVVVSVTDLPTDVRGEASFELDSEGTELRGSVDGAVEADGTWQVGALEVSGLSTHVTGHATGTAFDKPFSGRLDIQVDDAGMWGGILGRYLAGSGQLAATFAAADQRQRVSVSLSAKGAEVSVQDMPDFEAEELSFNANIEDWEQRRISNVDLQGVAVEFGLVRFDVLRARANVTGEDADIWIEAAGNYLDSFTAKANGKVLCVECPTRTVHVSSLEATWQEAPIRLEAPVEVVVSDSDFEVRGLDLILDTGRIRGDWSSAQWPGTGGVTAEHVPIGVATIFDATFPFTGRLSAEIRSDPEAGAPVTFDLSLSDVRLSDAAAADLSAVAFELEGQVVSDTLTFTSSLTASGDADLKIEGAIPLVADSFVVDDLSPLRASANGEVQTGFLGGLFLPPTEKVRGRLDVDFRVGGSVSDLELHGSARAEKIAFTSATSGMSLNGAAFEVLARGSLFELTGFKAEDGQGGTLTADGHVELAAGDGRPAYALKAELDKLRLISLDELNVTAGGALELTGRGRDLELAGKLTATSADLQLPESLPPEVVVIEVTHVNRGERFTDSGAAPDVPLPIALDLELSFPGRVSVHAPGLISEWRGEVFVKGTTEDVEVDGELKLIRGTVSTAGIRFRLTEGRFRIDDELSVPEVDLIAESSRNNIKAIASIRGPVNDPTFELTSEPPLPEDEILSRLLFGTTAGNLTPVQSVQLAQAVARFSGLSSGNDPLYMLQRQTGIDRVEIKSGDDGQETSISLGKYLTDRVFVSIDQGLTGSDSIARVEVELTDHLAAKTEVGQDATAGVGIEWRISY